MFATGDQRDDDGVCGRVQTRDGKDRAEQWAFSGVSGGRHGHRQIDA